MGGQRHVPAALTPGNVPGTHCIGGWVGPRDSLDGRGKSRPNRDSIPGPSSPAAIRCADWAIPVRYQVVLPTELPLL